MQTTAVGAEIGPLDNPVRDYPWGSTTAIPELLGESTTGRPQAELWMGAYPGQSSRVRRGGRMLSLLDCIDAAPERELGAEVVARFGPRLPFLFKIIAPAAPLSLQVHPDSAQAAAGYAAEDERGIPLSAPERNYRDPVHKPELLCALSPFEALCGFRPVPDTMRLLDAVVAAAGAAPAGTPAARATAELDPYVRALRVRPDAGGLREVVTGLLTSPADRRPALVDAVAAACAATADDEFGAELRTIAGIAEACPGDIGVLIALLLNRVSLAPGQAVFLPAGNLHAYLGGLGVEIMPNSDNVLRGGLTRKHVDVAELLRLLDTTDGPIQAPEPRRVGPAEEVYDTPVPDFRLSRLTLTSGAPVPLDAASPQIVLVTDGAATVSGAGAAVELPRGHSAWVPAGAPAALLGAGTAFRATANLPGPSAVD